MGILEISNVIMLAISIITILTLVFRMGRTQGSSSSRMDSLEKEQAVSQEARGDWENKMEHYILPECQKIFRDLQSTQSAIDGKIDTLIKLWHDGPRR